LSLDGMTAEWAAVGAHTLGRCAAGLSLRQEVAMPGDARGYRWDPFEPGNEAAVKHGARSPRKVAPIAERLRHELATSAPWTTGAAFAAVVHSWSQAEARCELLRNYLDEVGLLDDEGEPRPALKALNEAERAADRARQQLGLSPSAWASLYRTLTVGPDGSTDSLAALRATGRQMLTATTSRDEPHEHESAANDTDGIPVPQITTGPYSGQNGEQHEHEAD
jgi:hypothetical protein